MTTERRVEYKRGEIFRRKEIISKTEKEKTHVKINFRPFKTFILLVFLVLAVYYLFFSGVFRVKEVEVSGIRSVEISDKIKTELRGKHILLLNISSFLRSLTKEFPVLQEVRVVRALPNRVEVNGSERESALVWCSKDCYKMDPSGYVYEKVDKPQDKTFIQEAQSVDIMIGQKVAAEKFIIFYVNCVSELNKMGIQIKSADVSDMTYNLSFQSGEGWRIIFDTSQSLDNQLDVLKQVLSTNKADVHEYVNLGVEGQAYLK